MSPKKFVNSRKDVFLKALAAYPSLDDTDNDLTIRSKFNFSYFDSSQPVGQNFRDWNHKQLYELLDKIKNYTTKPLSYWLHQRCGGGGLKVFTIYGAFPTKTNFFHPKHIPHQAQWARFRLDNATRLIGFVVPNEVDRTSHKTTSELYDKNTFYVVFLDENHQFYMTEQK